MFLARPDLTEKILQSVADHSLTAVVAPLGYGKSTLARAAAPKLPGKSYYYAVPAGPHDGHFVWHDLCLALKEQGLDVAPSLRQIGLPETASQARQALDLLRGQSGPLCLILDDYHYVTDPLMDAFWERAAREAIPHLHILMLSRTRPDVNLEEMRLKGQARLFEQNFLTFSLEETEAFFRENGLSNPAAAAQSQRYSEGWPAVLWLCLQSWRQNGRIAASGDIDSLLASAVFAAYSPDEQDLLLRLAVFESFREEDAEKIGAGAGWLPVSLLELRRKNAFLSFDAKTEIYQFHSIFRDFLRKRLLATARIDKPSLYRLAGECCFERRDHVSAFRFFHQAGRDEDLLRLLDTFRGFADKRSLFYFAEELFQAALNVPWRVRLANPLGWLAFVALYTLMWKDHRTVGLLDEAEERFRAAPEISEPLKKSLQGEIEIIRGNMVFNDLNATTRHYKEAARLLNGPSLFASKSSVWNYRSPSLSFIALSESGGYREVLEQHTRLLRAYNVMSGGKLQNADSVLMAEYQLERGDFSEVEARLTETLNICGNNDRLQMSAMIAAFGLARYFAASGGAEKALPLLEALRLRVASLDLIELFDSIDAAQGYVAAVLGKLEAIPRWLRDGEIFDPPHTQIPHVFGIGLTVHGKALALRGEYQRLALLAPKIPEAAPIECLFARLHGAMLAAVAAWHTRGQSEALKLLGEALDMSRPDGLVLPLAEYGGHILPLLRRLNRARPGDAHLEAVLALAGRIARLAAAPGQRRKKLLTPREEEIMRHVAKGESNPAIAAQLNISVNAVKYLLGKVCAKLGAYSRMDAARRFNELELVRK